MATVAVVGASGYAGQETLDRVLTHPALELYALGSDSLAGQAAHALDPRLGRNGWSRIPRFITNDAALSCGADVTLVCLPHEEAARLVPAARGVVVDLSGAHRFADADVYPAWYGFEHPEPSDLASWSYGLPEVSPPTGRLIANPGCYAPPRFWHSLLSGRDPALRRRRRQVGHDGRPFSCRFFPRGRRARNVTCIA
jgi:N-acetyl-gamma-glutamyl-phosphate reductase